MISIHTSGIIKKSFYILTFCLLALLFSKKAGAETLTEITRSTYPNDNIAKIHIGEEVTSIEYGSFNNLLHLYAIEVDDDNENYSSYNGCLYNKDKTMLICVPQGLHQTTIASTAVKLAPCALAGKTAHFRKRVKDIIGANNKGVYNGYDGKTTNPKDQTYYVGGTYQPDDEDEEPIINSSTMKKRTD